MNKKVKEGNFTTDCFIADEIALYFGKWNIEIAEPGGEVRGVNKITIHPGYDDVTLQNDLALLELKTTLNFTDKIQPICMPQSPVSAGEETFVLGWGDSRGTAEEHLLQACHKNCFFKNSTDHFHCTFLYELLYKSSGLQCSFNSLLSRKSRQSILHFVG